MPPKKITLDLTSQNRRVATDSSRLLPITPFINQVINQVINQDEKRLACHAKRSFTLADLKKFTFDNTQDGRDMIDRMLKESMGAMFKTKWSFAPTVLLETDKKILNERLMIARVDFIEILPWPRKTALPRMKVVNKFKCFLSDLDKLTNECIELNKITKNKQLLPEYSYGP